MQDNVICLFRSQLEGHWKIGLKKAFVEALQKLNHYNAVFALAERHGKLMEFSQCYILSAIHGAGTLSLSLTPYIQARGSF